MNYCAYELLSIVYTCECIGHPEMIPSPRKIRMDPEFSDALDFLLDNGYVIACKARHSENHVEVLAVGLGIFDFTMESLTITPHGTNALQEESAMRVNLRCCS